MHSRMPDSINHILLALSSKIFIYNNDYTEARIFEIESTD